MKGAKKKNKKEKTVNLVTNRIEEFYLRTKGTMQRSKSQKGLPKRAENLKAMRQNANKIIIEGEKPETN